MPVVNATSRKSKDSLRAFLTLAIWTMGSFGSSAKPTVGGDGTCGMMGRVAFSGRRILHASDDRGSGRCGDGRRADCVWGATDRGGCQCNSGGSGRRGVYPGDGGGPGYGVVGADSHATADCNTYPIPYTDSYATADCNTYPVPRADGHADTYWPDSVCLW